MRDKFAGNPFVLVAMAGTLAAGAFLSWVDVPATDSAQPSMETIAFVSSLPTCSGVAERRLCRPEPPRPRCFQSCPLPGIQIIGCSEKRGCGEEAYCPPQEESYGGFDFSFGGLIRFPDPVTAGGRDIVFQPSWRNSFSQFFDPLESGSRRLVLP